MKTALSDPRRENYAQFVQNIPDEHRPGLQDLAHHYIAHNHLDVMGELIRLGHLPEWAVPEQRQVDYAQLERFPEEFREYAATLDQDTLDEYELMAPHVRDRVMQQQMEHAQMKQREYQQAAETAVREWNQQMDTIENRSREAILEAVESLQPFTEDGANERAQDYCILATWAQMVNDPHLQNLREVAGEGFRLAAEERWRGNEELARGREINARRLFAEFNKEFKAKLDANIKQFQLFFQHAPGARASATAQNDQSNQYVN